MHMPTSWFAILINYPACYLMFNLLHSALLYVLNLIIFIVIRLLSVNLEDVTKLKLIDPRFNFFFSNKNH